MAGDGSKLEIPQSNELICYCLIRKSYESMANWRNLYVRHICQIWEFRSFYTANDLKNKRTLFTGKPKLVLKISCNKQKHQMKKFAQQIEQEEGGEAAVAFISSTSR